MQIRTNLTGSQLHEWKSYGRYNGSSAHDCIVFTDCDYTAPAGTCSRECYVVYKEGQQPTIDFTSLDVVGIFGGIFVMGIGACSVLLCILCCHLMPCTNAVFDMSSAQNVHNMQGAVLGKPEAGAAPRPKVDISTYMS